ncbi:tetratricopeptide repeat protein [Parapedobacter deserti]|uniref:Tetratricopeptide repeat protein n=1 Tax=Parapedobacter deserti TaxID=1912957 RepID=A0ABV7JHA3_9SPHI
MNTVLHAIALPYLCFSCLTGYAQDRQPDDARLVEFYQTQQYREAAEYLNMFYPETTADPTVLSRLAYCYRMAGDYNLAEQYYLRLHAQDSLHIPTLLNLGAISVQRGLYVQATSYYERVIAIDTAHLAAYKALSGLMIRKADFETAYRYFASANKLQPSNSDIAYDFAKLCMDFDQYVKADSVLQAALQTDPRHGMLLLGKIQVAEKLEVYPEMVSYGRRLLEQGDESPVVLSLLARGYFHTNNFAGAKETYDRMLALYERMGELDYYYLAMSYKAMKHYKEALSCMDKVLELAVSTNTAFYYGRKADLHDLANQPSSAVASYVRSLQFEVVPLHYYSLGVVYDRKLSDKNNALRYYRLYLKQNPSEKESRYITYVQQRIKELERLK